MSLSETHPYTQSPTGIYYRPALRADTEAEIAARPSAWSPAWGGGTVTPAGESITPARAMSLPAYYACIRAIAEDVAKLPLVTYERLTPRGKARAMEHPLYALLHDAPNADMTAMTFRETLTAWALGWGNGFAEIERSRRGEPLALWPIHPARIPPESITRDADGNLVYDVRVFALDPAQRSAGRVLDVLRIPAENMVHIKGLGDGYYGYSIAQLAAESIGVNLAAQTFAGAFFGNGLHVGAVLEHPLALGDTALRHLRESFAERYQGSRRAHQMMILEEGMKYQRLGIPPDEAQFIESRQLGIEDTARLFRMPPHKIQHLLRSTNNNIEHQALEYVTDTLLPWLVRWEQELKRKLFADDAAHFAEHVVLGLLRGDMQSRAAYMWQRFQMGSLSPDDIRELENENPTGLPEGADYYIQANMVPLQAAGQPLAQPSRPVPRAAEAVAAHLPVSGNGVHHAARGEGATDDA